MIKQILKADYKDDLIHKINRAEAAGWTRMGALVYQTSFNGGYFLQELIKPGLAVVTPKGEQK